MAPRPWVSLTRNPISTCLVLTSRELTWKERGALTDAMFEIGLNHDVVISTLVISAPEWSEGGVSVLPIRDEVECYGVAA